MRKRTLVFSHIAALGILFCGVFHAGSALSATTVAPFQELTGSGIGALFRMQVDGLPAMTAPSFRPAELRIPQREAFSLGALNGDPFVQPNQGSRLFTFNYAGTDPVDFNVVSGTDFAVVGLEKGDAPAGSTIYVGTGPVQRENAACVAQVDASGAAHCAIVTPYPSGTNPNFWASYWTLVASPTGSVGQQYQLTLSHAELHQNNLLGFLATGPGHIDSGVTQPVRLAQTGPIYTSFFPFGVASEGERYYGVVGIFSPDQDYARALLPFAYTVKQNSDDNVVSIPLPPINGFHSAEAVTTTNSRRGGSTPPIVVRPGATLSHVFFDIPPNLPAGTPPAIPLVLSVDAENAVDDSKIIAPSLVSIRLVRADFPQQSSSPEILGAPSGGETLHYPYFELDNVQSGRWFVVVTNNSNGPIAVSAHLFAGTSSEFLQDRVGVQFPFSNTPPNLGGSNLAIAPGTYYNPQRSGHGVSICQARGQQMLFWYTYLEDGTPTWYQAQADAPVRGGWWQAPLYRVAWDGSKAHLTPVGSVTLTPTADNQFVFTWNLEGRTGSEAFNQLARFGDCPTFNGVITNLNGAWYAPSLSGYGMDVLALPEQQFNLFYLYDSFGLARWGVGNSLPFTANSTLAFRQNTGFCPSCAYTPVTSQPLGTATIDYTSSSTGNLATNFVLQPPLTGTWNTNRPMTRLTGSSACVQ